MDELIQQLTSRLGIDASVAKTATAKAMAMVREHVGDDLFSKISAAIPGAHESAVEGAAAPAGDSGGMLGKLIGMASTALGSEAGGGLELAASLTGAGVDKDKIGGFLELVIAYIKEKAGAEVVDQVLAKFPMLKTLLG